MKALPAAAVLAAYAGAASAADVPVVNPSFEVSGGGGSGWNSLSTGSDEFWAPPGGTSYATREGGEAATTQALGVVIEADTTYTLEMYARSWDPRATDLLPHHLANATYHPVTAELQLLADGLIVVSASALVSAPQLSGVAHQDGANAASDDGANIWFDGGYRMHVGERFFYQSVSDHPIHSPWLDGGAAFDGMAMAPATEPASTFPTPSIYATFYNDGVVELPSRMDRVVLSGVPPNYVARAKRHRPRGRHL